MTTSRTDDTGHPAPTVSVITAAYNAEAFIAETIESARQQTFTDFELLIVDDGSTDDTPVIAARYAAEDPRIRLSRQENRGIGSARNTALARARGQYLAFLDSDDMWLPTYLAEQLRVLERQPEIAVLSGNAFNLGGQSDGEPLLPVGPAGQLRDVSLLDLVRADDSMSILSVLRREVAEALGGFDDAYRRSEDYDFWLRAAAAGFRLAINPRPLGLYRRRPNSLSSDELAMLQAMQRPLTKLRGICADRPDICAAIDVQLAQLVHRELTAGARLALAQGDMPLLASRLEALAASTGSRRYRLARWLTVRAPVTVRWAYRLKQLRERRRARHRATPSAAAPFQPVSRANL